MNVDPQTIEEVFKALQYAYTNWGWMGLAGVLLCVAIRLYRHPAVEWVVSFVWRRIFRREGECRLLWRSWPMRIRKVLPFVLSFVGGVLVAKTSLELGWVAAILGGLVSSGGLGGISLLTHKGTKKLGDMEAQFKIHKDIDYRPNWFRRQMSIAVPIEKAVERAKRKNGIV